MNELEIKMSLISYLSEKHSQEADTKFIKELFVENFNRRADVVMVNGHLSAYEIKSDLDNLLRLEGQLDSFIRHFEYVTVVCTKMHLEAVREKLEQDAWLKVGICLVDGKKISSIRRPKKNALKVDYWLSHLPVDELRQMLRENAVSPKGNRAELVAAASEHISKKPVREFVLRYFKRRDGKIQAMKKKGSQAESRLPKVSINDELIRNYEKSSINVQVKPRVPRQMTLLREGAYG